MDISQDCQKLRIYIGEAERSDNKPLYEVLIAKARALGLAGATVFRSPLGFGANSVVHTSKLLNLSTDLPIVLEFIDEDAKIQDFIAQTKDLITGGIMTIEPVKVLHYKHREG